MTNKIVELVLKNDILARDITHICLDFTPNGSPDNCIHQYNSFCNLPGTKTYICTRIGSNFLYPIDIFSLND